MTYHDEVDIDKYVEAIGVLATIKPTMEMNIHDPVSMALEVSSYTLEMSARIAELEAKIGMKNDALNSFSEFYDWCLETLGYTENDYCTDTENNMKHRICHIAELEAERDTQRELIGRPAEAIYGEYHDMRVRVAQLELKLELAQGTISVCENYIKELQEEHRWIPVETLPKTEGHYIVHVTNKSHHFGDWETRNVYECVYSETGWHTANEVIRWMKLPEAMEEDE